MLYIFCFALKQIKMEEINLLFPNLKLYITTMLVKGWARRKYLQINGADRPTSETAIKYLKQVSLTEI